MRLIDANKLIAYVDSLSNRAFSKFTFTEGIIEAILEQPTVDAKQVVHAHWTEVPYAGEVYEEFIGKLLVSNYKCSACGCWSKDETDYCSCCGAIMDEEVEESEDETEL